MPINPENPILAAMSRAWDVLIAVLLFLLCALPLVTFGASMTALYATLMAVARDECGSVAKKFFKTFVAEFKIATEVWMILLAAGLLLAADIWACWFWQNNAIPALPFLRSITVIFGIIWLCVFSYAFSGIARYVVSLTQVFRNCLTLSVQNPGHTVLIAALYVAVLATIYLAGVLAFPAWFVILYWLAKLYIRVFERAEKEVGK